MNWCEARLVPVRNVGGRYGTGPVNRGWRLIACGPRGVRGYGPKMTCWKLLRHAGNRLRLSRFCNMGARRMMSRASQSSRNRSRLLRANEQSGNTKAADLLKRTAADAGDRGGREKPTLLGRGFFSHEPYDEQRALFHAMPIVAGGVRHRTPAVLPRRRAARIFARRRRKCARWWRR